MPTAAAALNLPPEEIQTILVDASKEAHAEAVATFNGLRDRASKFLTLLLGGAGTAALLALNNKAAGTGEWRSFAALALVWIVAAAVLAATQWSAKFNSAPMLDAVMALPDDTLRMSIAAARHDATVELRTWADRLGLAINAALILAALGIVAAAVWVVARG